MDAFVLKAIAGELGRALKGGVIDKVHQPNRSTITLELRAPSAKEDKMGLPRVGNHYQLLLSADSQQARAHLSDVKIENPPAPPPFCMLLKKHLVGCKLMGVSLRGLERALHFQLQKRDPVGRIVKYLLVAEVMGRHSNIILIEGKTGLIINTLKPAPATKQIKRPLLRDLPYEPPPPQGRQDPLAIQEKEFLALANSHPPGEEEWLVKTFEGLSPTAARGIARLNVKKGWWPAFHATMERVAKGEFRPGLLVSNEDPEVLTVLPAADGEQVVAFESMNAAANDFYGHRVGREKIATRRKELLKRVRALLVRRRKTAKAIQGDLARAKGAEAIKQKGDLLTANFQSISKGATSVTLADPVSGEIVEITLEPRLSPSENVQRYFRRYKKLKRLVGYGPKRLKAIETSVHQLEITAAALEKAPDLDTLESLAKETALEGSENKKPDRPSKKPAPPQRAAAPRAKKRRKEKGPKEDKEPKKETSRAVSSPACRVRLVMDGWEILVGKNSRGNDRLLREVARPNDLWLHAEGYPGSHVLIQRKGARGEIPLPVLEEAAGLAAAHSKANKAGKVAVAYTQVKHVRRVKGGRAGQVSYTDEKTLLIPPKVLDKEVKQKG